MSQIVSWRLTFCWCLFALTNQASAIVVARSDANYDITLYLNGQPLRAQTTLNMPAFQQVHGVVLPSGQRVPPPGSSSALRAGVVSMVIYVDRIPTISSAAAAFGSVSTTTAASEADDGEKEEEEERKDGDVTITISKSS